MAGGLKILHGRPGQAIRGRGRNPTDAIRMLMNTIRKRMGSGDPPGLQNRRAAGLPVAGAFDSHTLPPMFTVGCVEFAAAHVQRLRL